VEALLLYPSFQPLKHSIKNSFPVVGMAPSCLRCGDSFINLCGQSVFAWQKELFMNFEGKKIVHHIYPKNKVYSVREI